MRRTALGSGVLLTAILVGFLASPAPGQGQRDQRLSERIAELEDWQAQVEARLKQLEDAVGIGEHKTPKTKSPRTEPPKDLATNLITVRLSNKRFESSDWSRDVYEDAIWWDVEYTPSPLLSKPTRATKGTLEFADLFGEVHFRLRVTVNDAIRPGRTLRREGTGFKYNQFLDKHNWMRRTDFEDMKIVFRIESIIYEDGSTEKF